MRVRVPYSFKPRWYQRDFMRYFDCGGKRGMGIWHRRAGKDLVMLNQECKMAHELRGVYWHTMPLYEQARKYWNGFTSDGERTMESVFPKVLRRFPREWKPNGEMLVELKNGSIIMLLGSDTMDSSVGTGPRHVTFSEYGLCKPTSWQLVSPMLRENGGSAAFITTPRGKNHAFKLWEIARADPSWFSQKLSVLDTGLRFKSIHEHVKELLTPEQMMDEERAAGMLENFIRQEYLVDFTAALVGSYYGDLLEVLEKRGMMEAFPHDVDDVFVTCDLGRSDCTSLWFWRLNEYGGVDFLDHYEANGKHLSFYFELLEEWTRTKGYHYKKIFLPHDAKAKTLVSKLSILEQTIERFGSSRVTIVPDLSIHDGIQAVRWLLQQFTRFHPRCSKLNHPGDNDGIECLKQYHREWDEERRCFKETPEHDWTSHTSDAMRYAAVVVRMVIRLMEKPKPAVSLPVAVPADRSFNLETLFADRERRPASGRI